MVWNDCCPISFVYSICLFSWILDELFQFVFLFLFRRRRHNVCFGALACRLLVACLSLAIASLLLLLEDHNMYRTVQYHGGNVIIR